MNKGADGYNVRSILSVFNYMAWHRHGMTTIWTSSEPMLNTMTITCSSADSLPSSLNRRGMMWMDIIINIYTMKGIKLKLIKINAFEGILIRL